MVLRSLVISDRSSGSIVTSKGAHFWFVKKGNTEDTLTGGVGHFPEAVCQRGESGKEVRSARCNQVKRRI